MASTDIPLSEAAEIEVRQEENNNKIIMNEISVPFGTLPRHFASVSLKNALTLMDDDIPDHETNDLCKSTGLKGSYYVLDKEAKGNKQLNEDVENLVFRGGGMKGIAYCGALDVLTSIGMLKNVKRFAGTSAGAMFSTFLALGYTSIEIEHMFRTTNFKAFKDAKKGFLAKMENLYKRFGMFEGKVFYEWMGRKIEHKTGDPDTTFEQLYKMTQKELVVVGTCLSHCEVHYFSHHLSPQMKIRDAVRISMSIPLFFEPVIEGDHFFVDGCVLDNFPLWIFDSPLFDPEAARLSPVNMKTIGFYIVEDSEVDPEVSNIKGLKGYIGCMLNAFMNRISQLAFKPGDDERMMHIRARHVQAANFGLGDEEKDLLFHEGQLAARRFYGVTEAHLGEEFVKVNQLIVKLKSGKDLQTGLLRRDIYVTLSMGNETKKSTIKKSNNPVWDDIYVFKALGDHVLKIEVCSAKSIRSDRCIADHEIKLSDLQFEIKKDITLTVDDGHITLQLMISPPV